MNPTNYVKSPRWFRSRLLTTVMASSLSVVGGMACRSSYGPDWTNFWGAALVALGGFFFVAAASKLGSYSNDLGIGLVAMGGGFILIGAYPV